jgi:hypothetical protein
LIEGLWPVIAAEINHDLPTTTDSTEAHRSCPPQDDAPGLKPSREERRHRLTSRSRSGAERLTGCEQQLFTAEAAAELRDGTMLTC